MAQTFLDYNGQVDKLANEKGLIISDREYAIDMLTRISYFSLIGGYKNIFINPTMNKYKRGVKFEDIVSLYRFDEDLRSLFLKYILKFERKLHSVISYQFTDTYGENQSYYLDVNNFDYISDNEQGIKRLGRIWKLKTFILFRQNPYRSNINESKKRGGKFIVTSSDSTKRFDFIEKTFYQMTFFVKVIIAIPWFFAIKLFK